MNNYKDTIKYWNNALGKIPPIKDRGKPKKPMQIIEIENGLKWLIEEGDSIIDFGCGIGSMVIRSICLGANKAIGIDISPKAIKLAKQTSELNNMNKKVEFEIGGIELLKKTEENSIDAGISFNIIDNILPDDAIVVLKEMNRIIKKKGKLLIKLNEIIHKSEFEKTDFYKLISEDFYKEKSGLYFWNLSNTKFEEIVSPFFQIVKYIEVSFPNTDYKNRLYYIENRK